MSHGWQSKSSDGSKHGWRQRSVFTFVIVLVVAMYVLVVGVVLVVQ